MSFGIGRIKKNDDLKSAEIKNFLETSRMSLKDIAASIEDVEIRGRIAQLCSTIYELNESVSAYSGEIDKHTKDRVIEIAGKIEQIAIEKNLAADPKSVNMITTQSLKMRKWAKTETALAAAT